VRTVDTDRPRRPRGRESWFSVDSSYRIVELTTGSATLEWALAEDKLEWAVACVRSSDIPSA